MSTPDPEPELGPDLTLPVGSDPGAGTPTPLWEPQPDDVTNPVTAVDVDNLTSNHLDAGATLAVSSPVWVQQDVDTAPDRVTVLAWVRDPDGTIRTVVGEWPADAWRQSPYALIDGLVGDLAAQVSQPST